LLVTLLTIAVVAQCGTGAVNALDVFFVTRNLHASAHLYGFLGMTFGIGAIAAGRVVQWLGARRALWLGLLVAGAPVVGYARQTGFMGGVLLAFVIAIPMTMVNTAMTPLMLASTPREYLGRMLAVFNPVNQLASMLSVVVAGWLASTVLRNLAGSLGGLRFGPIDTIFTVSGLLIVITGGYALIALPTQAAEAASTEAAAGVT